MLLFLVSVVAIAMLGMLLSETWARQVMHPRLDFPAKSVEARKHLHRA